MKTLTILIVFLIVACEGADVVPNEENFEVYSMVGDSDIPFNKAPSVPVAQQPKQEIEKKVVKSGSISYQVENTKSEYSRIKDLLEKYEGYINSENESKGYDRLNHNITIKVPPQNFDGLITDLITDRKIDSKWINTDDVTDRYYDLQSRITNKKKLEERYQEILKKAENVRDILEVERNLNKVRGEIESLQGQFKLLKHKVKFSTVEVSFYELIPYEFQEESRPGFGTRILNSMSTGWHGFLTFFVYLLALWPFGLLAIGIVWIVRKVRARRSKE